MLVRVAQAGLSRVVLAPLSSSEHQCKNIGKRYVWQRGVVKNMFTLSKNATKTMVRTLEKKCAKRYKFQGAVNMCLPLQPQHRKIKNC